MTNQIQALLDKAFPGQMIVDNNGGASWRKLASGKWMQIGQSSEWDSLNLAGFIDRCGHLDYLWVDTHKSGTIQEQLEVKA